MFIAVYEFKIKPGKAEVFRISWLKTTKGIFQEFGSLGSRLHSTKDPLTFIAYAQWPNINSWKNNIEFKDREFKLARETMSQCIESSKTVYELEVTDDYLQEKQHQHGSK